MSKQPTPNEHAFLLNVIEGLQDYSDDNKLRILRTVMTYFNLASPVVTAKPSAPISADSPGPARRPTFSEHAELTPKEFLKQKAPRTDIERVACLAYYLTHYRDISHFKTLEINKLNTEAAQPKFSNASYSVENAVKQGYLAPAGRGMKQLSANGEHFVDALPDREAAKAMRESFGKRRSHKRSSKKKSRS